MKQLNDVETMNLIDDIWQPWIECAATGDLARVAMKT